MIEVQQTRDKYYVRPWRRYFAKSIDFAIFLLGLSFLGGIVVALVNPAWLPTTIVSTIIFTGVVLIASCVLEGVMISVLGTTFGKALFRTGVVNEHGGRLGMAKSIGRSLYCGAAGLGAGIPLVSLAAHIMGYTALESNGVTLWDKHMRAYVVHENMTRLNWIFGICMFTLTLAANIALNYAGLFNQ
jgi:hypothetical protein